VHHLTVLFAVFSVANAIAHGNSKTAVYEGNCVDGTSCSKEERQLIHDKLWSQCQAMGANDMSGGFDGGGYHFKYICSCVHGDTQLPFIYRDPDFSAEVTFGKLC
jgi:hypothetical protein